MKYDSLARIEDEKIYEDKLVAVFKGTAKRACTCMKCGANISKGENRITSCFERQPKGVHFHENCFGKCGDNETDFSSDGHNNQTNSICRENHLIMIFAKKYDIAYYTSLGFEYRGTCYIRETKNGYSEKVIEKALENGNTVKVNGVKVESAEQYRKMTLK